MVVIASKFWRRRNSWSKGFCNH
ncbi:hypothetical protein XAB3213_2220012 [Xanthomonas citri pv. bilvae]|nr:hypothetical protein XAB3213_2220012 [Xanthomonas citri pv. bilvae]